METTSPVEVKLTKGDSAVLVSLDKNRPLSKVSVILRWQVRNTTGEDFDPDAIAILTSNEVPPNSGFHRLLPSSEDATYPKNFIYAFYNQMSADGAVVHSGDDRTGDGSHVDGGAGIEGGGEQIDVDLDNLDPNCAHVYFVVSIDKADERKQNFGQIPHCSLTLTDAISGDVLKTIELDEDYAKETAMVVADLYRKDGGWKLKHIAQGWASGLAGIVENFGMHAKD
jgi:tellurium resistance protein TerD